MTFDMLMSSSYNPAFITAHGGTPASAEAALFAGREDELFAGAEGLRGTGSAPRLFCSVSSCVGVSPWHHVHIGKAI